MTAGTGSTTLPPHDVRCLEGSPDGYRLTSRCAAAIVAFGASLLLINLGDVRALTFHETVFAQPAREMLREGHWIVPTIGGVPVLCRTPVTAWCIAGSMALFQSEAEWVVRLPSVVATIATALILAAMTARWFGPRAGLFAGLMELTTVYALGMGRLAEADMPLCASVAGAMYLFSLAHVDGPRGIVRARRLPWAFHACVALSFMIKWFLGPAFIGLGCLAYFAVTRDGRIWRFLFHPIGLAIDALLTLPWFAAAYFVYPGIVQEVIHHHFERFDGTMGGLEPWYSYVYLVPFMLLPWTPQSVLAVAARLRKPGGAEPIVRFAMCWFLPGIVLLSCSSFRARNYAIPVLPPLVMLSGVGLHEYLRRRETTVNPWNSWLIAATIVGGSAAAAVVVVREVSDAFAVVGLLAAASVGCIAALVCERRRRHVLQAATLFATTWGVAVGVQTWVIPTHDSFRPIADLGRRVAAIAPPDATVLLFDLPEVQIPYYIDRTVESHFEIDRLVRAGEAPDGPKYVVASSDDLARLAQRGTVEVLDSAERKARHTYRQDRLALVRFTPDDATAVTAGRTQSTKR